MSAATRLSHRRQYPASRRYLTRRQVTDAAGMLLAARLQAQAAVENLAGHADTMREDARVLEAGRASVEVASIIERLRVIEARLREVGQ